MLAAHRLLAIALVHLLPLGSLFSGLAQLIEMKELFAGFGVRLVCVQIAIRHFVRVA